MPRKVRKQRVTLRFKRRQELKNRVRIVLVRSTLVAGVVGFGAGMITGGDSFLARFVRRHTPRVDVECPKVLAGLPVLSELPKQRVWLWCPGASWWTGRRIGRRFASVRSTRLEKNFLQNHVVVHLDPRVPLVLWNGSGLDGEGKIFETLQGSWGALPRASFQASAKIRDIGRWLLRLKSVPVLWSQVVSFNQSVSGAMELALKSNTTVLWGSPEMDPAPRQAQMLARVLDDAHKNLGGAARIDLRFFDQGRIIVLPKGK